MFYTNLSYSDKTVYGVTFKSGETKEVPGYINDPYMMQVEGPVIAKQSNTKQQKPSSEKPKKEAPKQDVKQEEVPSEGTAKAASAKEQKSTT